MRENTGIELDITRTPADEVTVRMSQPRREALAQLTEHSRPGANLRIGGLPGAPGDVRVLIPPDMTRRLARAFDYFRGGAGERPLTEAGIVRWLLARGLEQLESRLDAESK